MEAGVASTTWALLFCFLHMSLALLGRGEGGLGMGLMRHSWGLLELPSTQDNRLLESLGALRSLWLLSSTSGPHAWIQPVHLLSAPLLPSAPPPAFLTLCRHLMKGHTSGPEKDKVSYWFLNALITYTETQTHRYA